MIVCICANVNCKTVQTAIQQGADSVDALTMQTGACSGCGQCRNTCQQMLDSQVLPVTQGTPASTAVTPLMPKASPLLTPA
ncbi:MAG: (2Fe-2S)-binding protein [Limnobacter sp.]|nr:(2Fe-2S)-binding protein [Limnobacter sp.]